MTSYENSPRILLPWPPQEAFVYLRVAIVQFHILFRAIQQAVSENQACGLCRVGSTVCRDGVLLAVLRGELAGADEDEAVLEDGGGVAEDEVDVAFDTA